MLLKGELISTCILKVALWGGYNSAAVLQLRPNSIHCCAIACRAADGGYAACWGDRRTSTQTRSLLASSSDGHPTGTLTSPPQKGKQAQHTPIRKKWWWWDLMLQLCLITTASFLLIIMHVPTSKCAHIAVLKTEKCPIFLPNLLPCK